MAENIDLNQAKAIMEAWEKRSGALEGGKGLSVSTVSSLAGMIDNTGNLQKATQIANKMNYIGNTLGAFHQDSKKSNIFKPLSQTANTLSLVKMIKGFFPKKDTRVKSTKTLQQDPQDQFDNIGTSVAKAQKAASIGVAETLGGSFKEGIRDLGVTMSTDIKDGISGVRESTEGYLELRENNVANMVLGATDKMQGWTVQAGKTMLGGGKDVADTTVGAISNLTDTVQQGNQDIQNTLNNNLQGSPPYLRTLAESQKPAARKKALLDEMNTETEGNIKQIRKKRFRLIREYKELYFKPLAKEIVKAQAGGIFKKAFSAATLAFEVNWKKNVMAELTSIRRAVGGSKIDAWAKEKDFLASMPIIGNLFKKKPVTATATSPDGSELTVDVKDAYMNVKDADGSTPGIIRPLAEDAIVIGTNLFGGLQTSIDSLADTMSLSITDSLSNIPTTIGVGMIDMQDKIVDKFELMTTQVGSTLIDVQSKLLEGLTNTQTNMQTSLLNLATTLAHYESNPAEIWPDMKQGMKDIYEAGTQKIADKLGPKKIGFHDLADTVQEELEKVRTKLEDPNTDDSEIDALEEQFRIFNEFNVKQGVLSNSFHENSVQQLRTQNQLKDQNKEAAKQEKILARFNRVPLEELTVIQRQQRKEAFDAAAEAQTNALSLKTHLEGLDSEEERIEGDRRALATQDILAQIAENTKSKRKLELDDEGGLKGLMKKIPGFGGIAKLFGAISAIGAAAGVVLGPASGLLKTGGVFLKFAKFFSVIGLVALMIKPLYDSLKVFQETEGSFGDKLKAAGWEFLDSIVGMVTGMLGTVASAFGLDGLAKMFKDIEKDGIRAPIEKFFSEGIGLQIKNTLTPVFEILKKGFDMIFGPIQKFLGPGGKGEGIGKGLQDVLAIVKVGFGAFMSVFDSIMYALEPAIDILKKHIKFLGDIFMMALPTIKGIAGMFMNVAKIVLPLLMGIGVVMFKVMSPIIRLILKSFGVLQDILYPIIKSLFWGVNTVVQAITGIVNAIIEPFDFTSIDKAIASFINWPAAIINLPVKLVGKFTSWLAGLFGFEQFSKELATFTKEFSVGKIVVEGIRALGFGWLIDNIVGDIGEIPTIIGEELKGVLQAVAVFAPKMAMKLILFFTEFPAQIIQRIQQVIGRTLDFDIVRKIIPKVKAIGGAILKPLDFLSDVIGKIPIFGKTFKGGMKGAINGIKGVGSAIENVQRLGELPKMNPLDALSGQNAAKRLDQMGSILTGHRETIDTFTRSLTGKDGIFGKIGNLTKKFVDAGDALKDGKGAKAALSNFTIFGDIFKNAGEASRGLDVAAESFKFLAPLRVTITKVGGFAKTVFSVFTKVGDVLAGLMKPIINVLGSPAMKTALKANPIGFIFTAFDTLFQGITGFIEGFKEGGILGGIQGMLEGVFMALIGDMVDMIVKIPVKLVGWIIGLFPGGDKLKEQLFAFADAFSIKKLLKPLFDIKTHLNALWEGFKVGGPIEAIKSLITSVLDGFTEGVGALIDSVLGVFGIEFAEGGFAKWITPFKEKITNLITLAIDSIYRVPQIVFSALTGFVTGFIDGFKTDGLVGGIKEGINGMIAAPIKLVESFINRIASLFGLGKVDFSSTIEKIQNSVQAILHYPLEIFSKVGDKFTAFFDYVWDNIIPPWMKNIITTVTDPIKELAEWIPNAFARIVQFAKDNLDPRKLAGKLKFWGKDKEEGPEPLKKEGTEKEKSWDSELDKKTKNNLNKRLELINEIGEMELDSKQRQKKIQKLKIINDDLGFDLQKLHHKQLNEEQQNIVTKLAHHHEEQRLREEAEKALAEVDKGDDPLKALKDQLSAPDLTGMSTVVKTDPNMIEGLRLLVKGNDLRKDQLNVAIKQLERIYTCLYNMEGPIENLDKNKVAESIKEIAETSTTAKEAQEKSEPIVAEVKKAIQAEADATMDFSDLWSSTETEPVRVKISDEIKDDKLEAHQKQIADRTAALAIGQAQKEAWQRQHALNIEAAEKRKTEILASTQIKDEVLQKELKELNLTLSAGETKAETEDSLMAGFEGLTRSQNTKELVSAIENLEESKEDKQEAKRDGITAIKEFDKTLANAPIMNDPVMPDFNEGWEPTWSSNLGNTIEKIKNNPYLNKGLDALEGTKLSEWLGKQQEGFGHTMASSGVNLVQAFQDGGKEGLYRAGTDMIAPHTVVGKLLTNSKDTETKVGKAASMLSAFKQGGKEGFLANVVGQATEVKPGEDKKWWQAGLQFAQSSGVLDKATGDGGIGQAKKLWDTGINFFTRGEKQIDDSEKTGVTARNIGSKLKGFILGKVGGKTEAPPAEGAVDKILNKDGGVISGIQDKVSGKVSAITEKFSGIKDFFSKIKEWFSGGILKVFEAIGNVMKTVGKGIASFLKGVGQGIAGFVNALAGAAGSVAPALPVVALIAAAILGLAVALRIAAPAFEAFAKIISAFGKAIAVIIGALAQGIKTVLGGIGEFLEVLASFKITQMVKIVAFIFGLAPAFVALGIGLAAFAATAFFAKGAMNRLGTILGTVAKLTEGGKITQKFNAVGEGMLKMSRDIKEAAKELTKGETKDAIKAINGIMDAFSGGSDKPGGILNPMNWGKKKSSMPKSLKIPSIEMGQITANGLHLKNPIVSPIAPDQAKKLMDQETLGRVHLSDSTLSTLKNYTMAYVWDPLKRIALATESLLLPIEQLAYPSAPVIVPPTALNMDYGTPQTAMQIKTAEAERYDREMELRTMSHMEGSSQTAINAPTANVQNNTTYQSVKPNVRDDKRMRTMSIVGYDS